LALPELERRMEAHALTIQASTWPSIDSTMAESWRLLDVSPAACWDLSRGAQGALSPEFEPVLRWALAPVDLVHQLSQNRVKSLHPRGRMAVAGLLLLLVCVIFPPGVGGFRAWSMPRMASRVTSASNGCGKTLIMSERRDALGRGLALSTPFLLQSPKEAGAEGLAARMERRSAESLKKPLMPSIVVQPISPITYPDWMEGTWVAQSQFAGYVRRNPPPPNDFGCTPYRDMIAGSDFVISSSPSSGAAREEAR